MGDKYIGYIYIIKNKLDKSKVYIGQTRTTIEKRWTQHKSASRCKPKNSVLYNAMNKYGVDNFEIFQLEKIEKENKECLVNKLNELEIYYIKYYNSIVPNGYNITKGGYNSSIRLQKSVTSYFYNGEIDKVFESASEASRFYSKNEKSDATHIIRCCNGESNYCYQRIWRFSEDSFDKFPVTISKEKLENGKLQPVDKYTLDKKFIKSYDSISDAIKDDDQVKNPSPIKQCCDGILNQAYGYIWRFKNDDVNEHEWKDKNYTAVDAYSIDGKLLNSFKSISDAQKFYKIISNSHIIGCCNGQRNTCNNMVWRYKGDPFDKYDISRKKRKDQLIFNRYDLQNRFIETIYGSRQLPNSSDIIIDCCNGLRTHVKDSKWFFANDMNNPDKTKIIGEPQNYNTYKNIECIFNKYIEPVCVYDRYGNLINKYNNALEALKALLVYTQIIYDICDGKIAYNNNLVYRYEKDAFNLYYDFSYVKKHINIYDKYDNFIMQCFNIQECIRQLKLNTKRGSSIEKCLSHERKFAYGYKFFRVDDQTQPDLTKIINIENIQLKKVS